MEPRADVSLGSAKQSPDASFGHAPRLHSRAPPPFEDALISPLSVSPSRLDPLEPPAASDKHLFDEQRRADPAPGIFSQLNVPSYRPPSSWRWPPYQQYVEPMRSFDSPYYSYGPASYEYSYRSAQPFPLYDDYSGFGYSDMPYAPSVLPAARPSALDAPPMQPPMQSPMQGAAFGDSSRVSPYFPYPMSGMNSSLEDPHVMEMLLSQSNERIPDDYEDAPLTLSGPDNIVLPPSRSPSAPRTYPHANDGLGPLPSDNSRYGGYNMRRDTSGSFYSSHSSY